jgi:cyanoexosortase A
MSRPVSHAMSRQLWRMLALLLAVQYLVLIFMTQTTENFLNACIVWGCALLVLDGDPLPRRLQPTPLGCVLGTVLIVGVLWRSPTLVSGDKIRYLLPLMTGLGLALLARPWRQLRQFGPVFIIFSLLPLLRLLTSKLLVAELSQITAWLSGMLLMLCGFPVQRLGQSLYIPGGGVAVNGTCSGSEIMVQLLLVSIIFMVVFPMRYREQNLAMVVIAPLLAWLINGIRIALLALITASSYPGKTWWFDFFHHEWGSQLFSGTAMVVFVVVYVHWQSGQVARLMRG